MIDNPDLVIDDDGRARPTWATGEPLRTYYDTEWGMPIRDERGLFERLILEAFQSGLSWVTILRKRESFRAAFADFDPDTVAAYDDDAPAAELVDRCPPAGWGVGVDVVEDGLVLDD